MARQTFPRSRDLHERKAAEVLRRHVRRTGRRIEMPVPVELIVEQTFDLSVEYGTIKEDPGVMILGALVPADKRILLNDRHAELFEEVIGPERFTLAHELGHWVYDADDPDQLALDLDMADTESVFCYHRETPGIDEQLRIREINANGFASSLLMPAELVLQTPIPDLAPDRRRLARQWGVSYQALEIRLETLGYSKTNPGN